MKKGQTKKEPLGEFRMYFSRLPVFEKVEGPILGNFDHTRSILKLFGEFTGVFSYLLRPEICFDKF